MDIVLVPQEYRDGNIFFNQFLYGFQNLVIGSFRKNDFPGILLGFEPDITDKEVIQSQTFSEPFFIFLPVINVCPCHACFDAAFATAGATLVISLGSRGLGMMYSRPKTRFLALYALFTVSGTFSLARSARAFTAAIFISSLMALALTSRAPLKINGKPKHVVDLVWVVGTSGGENDILPCSHGFFIRDFRIGIGHGKNDGITGHRLQHLRGQDISYREAEKNVGTSNGFLKCGNVAIDGKFRFILVQIFPAR